MPIIPSIVTTPVSQGAFGKLAFDVMHHVFAIHDEYGRFFDEIIYKRELARRMAGLELEVAVDVVHRTFRKIYFADVIANQSGLFEFKAAETIHSRHRAQATHYLLLFGLHHAKIINMRPELVEHEFVNVQANLNELRNPKITDTSFLPNSPGAQHLREILLSLVHDWGAGLDLALYEEAITHFLGGESSVIRGVSVTGTGGALAEQKMRLIAPDAAFKLTAFPPDSSSHTNFRTHAQRLLNHTPLNFIQWINIHQTEITFNTLQRIQNTKS
jgi:GxxExxY protein